ncbi:MAG: flagellar biosynthesis protein FlhB [Oscillospiraceae bacterium]|nr:flagellar biosynthesis protein FlhB [Oscillospiraceae bacterium]
MPDSSGEKTEKASPKKRRDERKKGNVFMSKDVVTIVTLISSFYIIRFFIMNILTGAQQNFHNQMVRAATIENITGGDASNMFTEIAVIIATTIVPAMLIIGFIGIMATMAQTRFLFTMESLKFKMSRLNPLNGIKKMFSLKGLVELLKSLIKVSIIIAILYMRIIRDIHFLPNIIDMDVMQAAVFAGEEIMSLLLTVGIAFIAVAAGDFLYQRWDYERQIKMTKQEVKDEYKQMEGNPEIKGAIKRKQREFAEKRMMSQVKDADVVVRNPTHFAVALKYKIDEDMAPIVLAKGADIIAQKIIEEAQKHGVATVENPPLARGLYAASELEEPIPAEFFQPVAEVLAWVFSTKESKTVNTGYPARES